MIIDGVATHAGRGVRGQFTGRHIGIGHIAVEAHDIPVGISTDGKCLTQQAVQFNLLTLVHTHVRQVLDTDISILNSLVHAGVGRVEHGRCIGVIVVAHIIFRVVFGGSTLIRSLQELVAQFLIIQ